MADEPNNAEEQLKQYAGERRQQVPQEIHPATRNVLQGEVRRVYGSPEEERRAKFRLRWMQAAAWIAILAAIPLFLMQRQPKENVQDALPSQPGAVTLPTEKKGAEAPIVLSDTKQPVAPIVVETKAEKDVQPATAPLATREEVQVELSRRASEIQPERRARMVPAAATAAAANTTKLMFANTISNQQVLNRFQFEQAGERLKITEVTDGSVYSGRVFSQTAGADNFQIAGINRTLNKAVIVTGQVTRLQNSALQQQSQQNNLQNNASNNSFYNNTDNVRIQGEALIGNTQYKVDAQATPAQ